MGRVWGLLATIIAGASAYSSGAPGGACDTLLPRHGVAAQDNAHSPYSVTASTTTLTSGGTLEVTVKGSTNFKGFMIQVKDSSGESSGSFEDLGDSAKLGDCPTGKYVTHSGPQAKEMVKVVWRAPEHFTATVTVYATVVKDKNTFWVKLPSSEITVSKGDTSVPSTSAEPEPEPSTSAEPEPEPSTSAEPEPSTSAEAEPEPSTSAEAEPSTKEIPEHYNQCGKKSFCVGFGKTPQDTGCLDSGKCEVFASWSRQAGDKLLFTLESALDYVALGFSEDDDHMGEEVVLLCSSKGGEWYWNNGKQPEKIENISPKKISNVEGKLLCEIQTDMVFKIGDARQFRHVNFSKEVFPLLAGGGYDGGPSYHQPTGRLIPTQKVLMTRVGRLEAKSDILMQLHGLFMVVAWLGFAGIGMLLARYFKQTWVGKQIGGKDRWFQAHRLLMSLTVFFSLLGLLLVVIEKSGFDPIALGGAHPIVGLLTVLFAVTNPIMALFRPHPGTTNRPIFNWAHWAVGNTAHVLSVVTIFLAGNVYSHLVSSDSTHTAWGYLLLGYAIFHVTIHVILSLLWARGEQKKEDDNGNVTPMEAMTDISSRSVKLEVGSPDYMDAPNSKHRKRLLLVYILATSIITIVVISIIFKSF